MDYLEPPREPDESRPRRFPRLLAPPTVRRLSPTRLALTIVGVMTLFLAFPYIGYLSWSHSIRWLHGQSNYSVEFGDLILDPPPPPWFRGGREGFLKRLSHEANHERFSSLDLDLAKLSLKFRSDPLVRRVDRIVLAGPREIVVRLEYRQPVALPVFTMKQTERVAIDEEGVLIALADVELDGRSPPMLHGDPTPLIWFKGLDLPFNPQPGKTWLKSADSTAGATSQEQGVEDRRAAEAGELAQFIRLKLGKDKEIRKVVEHFVLHFYGRNEIFLQCGRLENSPMIRWRLPEGAPYSKSFSAKLTPSEKWDQVRAWLLKNPLDPNGPSLDLILSPKGLVRRPNEANP